MVSGVAGCAANLDGAVLPRLARRGKKVNMLKIIIKTLCTAFIIVLVAFILFIGVMIFHPEGAENVLNFFKLIGTNAASCGVTKICGFFIAQ